MSNRTTIAQHNAITVSLSMTIFDCVRDGCDACEVERISELNALSLETSGALYSRFSKR
jgi:hypothetical protein